MKRLIIFIPLLLLLVQQNYSQLGWRNKTDWEKYFKERISSLDPIEGIWSNTHTLKIYNSYNRLISQKYKPQVEIVAIFKSWDGYKTWSIDGDNSYATHTFENAASSGIYLFKCTYSQTGSTSKANAILTGNGLLEFSYEKPIAQLRMDVGQDYIAGISLIFEHKWIKVSPKKEDYTTSQKSSGTGFAISSNGLIVTTFHLVDRAKNINVRGINGDFNKTYKAKVMVSDKNNDLALIQIDDYSFSSQSIIPYTIKTNLAGVGENIYILGYPLRATMGDEIKLTNGIISSKTGFQGDITSYQISAPVQPGNSGGPLFNDQGNILGIVNAKHIGAENASYAIKSSYLMNLIELLDSPPKLQTSSILNGKSLPNRVEVLKKYVYIIEIN